MGENTPIDCVRLRNFNKFTFTAGPSFTGRENETLEDHKLFSGINLYLERKEINSSFPDEIEGDFITVTLRRYIPITDSFNDPMEISIHEKSSLEDLKIAAGKACSISSDRVRLLHLEPISMFVKEILKEGDIEICDCLALYVEALEEEDVRKGVFPPSSLARKLDADNNTIEVKFNLPNERLSDQTLSIDHRSPLRLLKEEISKRINVPISNFKLCVNALTKKEYKNLDISIRESKIFDGSAVFTSLGLALNNGEYFVKFYQYKMNENENNEEELNEFSYINSLVIKDDWNIDQLREKLIEVSVDVNNADGTPRSGVISFDDFFNALKEKKLRWREKLGKRAGRVILPHLSIFDNMKSALQDTTEIAIQLPNENQNAFNQLENDKENSLFVQLRRWNPSTWLISPEKIEIAINRETTGKELKIILNSLFDLPEHNIQIAKSPLKLYQTSKEEFSVALLNWEVPDFHVLANSPWYLKDGECVLFKDARETNLIFIDPSVSNKLTKNQGYEASIKIHTDFDD